MKRRCLSILCLVACGVALSALTALRPGVLAAADGVPGDVVAGRALAGKTCSACHSVSAGQRRTRAYKASGFDEIAAKPQTTAISLRAFLQTPHPTMPNLVLTPNERDNAIAYILSLGQRPD